MHKNTIATVIVLFDLAVTFILWILILLLEPLHVTAKNEVNKGVITPMDFTVMVS